ncbi:cyclodeaminase/cyclohydrolase family protein [Thermosediminibacter litoriperuensis]|uniref:Formiminotetrahydrofolate cyclodeaminase n=1 Tax=Thermosediminibacter litoriperuensis TaxID=291989 RepID=A0A5S5AQ08_9FIRM|nr:cyclodeaminase/cyclohydrolase family protein [Thermosediminibacter litoriperuensis]TYP52433.1 formiminotetrahydrofolate cyclodeaminase [Thermosediminibacter litoriperuensis]
MTLSEFNIKDFVSILASKEPAPGGGSASALVGAVGSALSSMVANLTLGKEKYKDKEPLMLEILKEGKELQDSLISMIDKDTGAFNRVAEVFKMPKDTEEQKAARSEAMQKALKEATLVPFTVMEMCMFALELHNKALGNSNTSAVSDLGVGALCLKTALQGAWLNVKINLNGIKDAGFAAEIEARARKMLEEGTKIADNIYRKVLEEFIR